MTDSNRDTEHEGGDARATEDDREQAPTAGGEVTADVGAGADAADVADGADRERDEADPARRRSRRVRSAWSAVTGGRGSAVLLAVASVAVIASVALGGMWTHRGSELQADRQDREDRHTAETIGGEYAVGAAQFDFRGLEPWAQALKNGTADSLDARFDIAVKTLSPLLKQIQWVQTAKLLAAKTTDVRDGRHFVVQVFVSTHMTSTQSPEGMTTVTPYTVTLDRGDDWRITDVAGIAGAGEDEGDPSTRNRPQVPR